VNVMTGAVRLSLLVVLIRWSLDNEKSGARTSTLQEVERPAGHLDDRDTNGIVGLPCQGH
jgi:hypothetical protein